MKKENKISNTKVCFDYCEYLTCFTESNLMVGSQYDKNHKILYIYEFSYSKALMNSEKINYIYKWNDNYEYLRCITLSNLNLLLL